MVAAVIVLYNPNMSLLDRLLRSVTGQLDQIFVIDNTPGPAECGSTYFDQYRGNILYVPLGENKGIATAQNVGIRLSIDAGHSHVILLDQDSALPSDMAMKLLDAENELVRQGKQVAAVGPLFVDEKTGKMSYAVRHSWLRVRRISIHPSATEPVETDYLIASGSLIRVSVFEQIGMMSDELFIDWVDVEWCHRARSYGLHSYVVPNVTMAHSVGDRTVRVLGKDINLHNDIRNYYIVRNATFLLKDKRMGWRWRLYITRWLPKYLFLRFLLAPQRWRTLSLLSIAFLDGLSGNMKRFSQE
jgi:rhamnosyltransferase